jgi:alanine racemase
MKKMIQNKAVYPVQTICNAVKGKFLLFTADAAIEHLVNDSRNIQQPATSLFFAMATSHNDGHLYLEEAYQKGVRSFVVSKAIDAQIFPDSNIIVVPDTLQALQDLAAFHRSHFQIPVIGITGSNGKTVVKEWLYQLLETHFNIVRSPKSYNSQIGVPLSVWQMNSSHTLAIFEAGISQPGEMEKLLQIIQPTIGVFTNIGHAHDAGFTSLQQKLDEKAKLFTSVEVLMGPAEVISRTRKSTNVFSWSESGGATLQLLSIDKQQDTTCISAKLHDQTIQITIPFTDDASIENAINCWCAVLFLKQKKDIQTPSFEQLHAVDMRLQLHHGINGCLVINDSYSADVTSLKIALNFLGQQSLGLEKAVILSDFADVQGAQQLYTEVVQVLAASGVNRIITVGKDLYTALSEKISGVALQNYSSTNELIADFKSSSWHNIGVLIKGARKFGFEKIAALFEMKLHQTVLDINLNALVHNVKQYQDLLQPNTKLMAMVKAFSYGSGSAEIASVLQHHNVHYLAVAYADEGIELVKAGMRIPVMVLNTEPSSFAAIVEHHLQPVIYSFTMLHQFEEYLKDQAITSYPVHIEVETGMNRLGFPLQEVDVVATHLSTGSLLVIQSVFSHLAASEDPAQDAFTFEQFHIFQQAVDIISKKITYPFLKHIANSAAIVRHPQLQLDMVRLGIGMYGVEAAGNASPDLQPVATLRSTVAQVKQLKKGESVSYNRRGMVHEDAVIATVRIGYADGYSRQFGNGVGKMLVHGQWASVIGSVCMDMTMINVTHIAGVKAGDQVIVFGTNPTVQQLADWINTIPYEIMTGISQRVKRVYFHE